MLVLVNFWVLIFLIEIKQTFISKSYVYPGCEKIACPYVDSSVYSQTSPCDHLAKETTRK